MSQTNTTTNAAREAGQNKLRTELTRDERNDLDAMCAGCLGVSSEQVTVERVNGRAYTGTYYLRGAARVNSIPNTSYVNTRNMNTDTIKAKALLAMAENLEKHASRRGYSGVEDRAKAVQLREEARMLDIFAHAVSGANQDRSGQNMPLL